MWYCQSRAELLTRATPWTRKKFSTFKINWTLSLLGGFTRKFWISFADVFLQAFIICRHPSQTAFLSSVDLHTQAGYQIMMPEVTTKEISLNIFFDSLNFSGNSDCLFSKAWRTRILQPNVKRARFYLKMHTNRVSSASKRSVHGSTSLWTWFSVENQYCWLAPAIVALNQRFWTTQSQLIKVL